MTSVDADLWGGRRLEAGRRSVSIIYNEKQNIPDCRQGRPNSIIGPPGKAVFWIITYTSTLSNKNVNGR